MSGRCDACGARLSADGACPSCLIDLALGAPEDDETRADASLVPGRDRIGPYSILELLGQGGMGIVYLAEQSRPIRRRVALKVIKPGMDSRQVITRFESERQALALMSHPNVAKVFDAGVSDDGRPYFVMEYVPGIPITEYSDRQRLSVPERLDLFLQACDALQHAHQKGIIHRDVKPSNLLVCIENERATVKVIDFGVAKATTQKLTEGTLYTQQGVVIGTPEYMSPEQAGTTTLDIDTRADIYSLGVVLYELLVGALPFDPKELRMAAGLEILRIIREDDPPKPSTRIHSLGDSANEMARRRRTDPPSLARLLSGDLEWITLRALEKDPGRRYASASEFAADLRRYTADEPVLAHAPSTVYRVSRFVRRHRAGVAAALFVAATLVAGLMATLWQARIALRGWTSAGGAGMDRQAAEVQRRSMLLPQFALYSYVTLAALGAVVYFTRATRRRFAGAVAGGASFAFLFFAQAALARSMGWWRYAAVDMPDVPWFLFATGVLCYGTILALFSWRVTRRFGWRGQLAFIGVLSVLGPVRDALGARLTELIVVAPGAASVMAWAILWACNVALLQGVMRLVAGPSLADGFAR